MLFPPFTNLLKPIKSDTNDKTSLKSVLKPMFKKLMLILVKESMTIFYTRNQKSNLRAFKTLNCVVNIKS